MRLVLLPGLDGTGRLFAPLLRELRLPAQVVSYPMDEILGYDELEHRIDLPDEPFAIVAESFSGPLALRLAHRARAVVLVASFVRPPVRWWPRFLATAWLFRLRPPAAVLEYFLADREQVPEVAAAIAQVTPAVLAHRIRCVLSVDASEALRACRVPILQLCGTRDRLVRTPIPGLRTVRLDAPHLVLQSAPAAAARAIEDFLRAG